MWAVIGTCQPHMTNEVEIAQELDEALDRLGYKSRVGGEVHDASYRPAYYQRTKLNWHQDKAGRQELVVFWANSEPTLLARLDERFCRYDPKTRLLMSRNSRPDDCFQAQPYEFVLFENSCVMHTPPFPLSNREGRVLYRRSIERELYTLFP